MTSVPQLSPRSASDFCSFESCGFPLVEWPGRKQRACVRGHGLPKLHRPLLMVACLSLALYPAGCVSSAPPPESILNGCPPGPGAGQGECSRRSPTVPGAPEVVLGRRHAQLGELAQHGGDCFPPGAYTLQVEGIALDVGGSASLQAARQDDGRKVLRFAPAYSARRSRTAWVGCAYGLPRPERMESPPYLRRSSCRCVERETVERPDGPAPAVGPWRSEPSPVVMHDNPRRREMHVNREHVSVGHRINTGVAGSLRPKVLPAIQTPAAGSVSGFVLRALNASDYKPFRGLLPIRPESQ